VSQHQDVEGVRSRISVRGAIGKVGHDPCQAARDNGVLGGDETALFDGRASRPTPEKPNGIGVFENLCIRVRTDVGLYPAMAGSLTEDELLQLPARALIALGVRAVGRAAKADDARQSRTSHPLAAATRKQILIPSMAVIRAASEFASGQDCFGPTSADRFHKMAGDCESVAFKLHHQVGWGSQALGMGLSNVVAAHYGDLYANEAPGIEINFIKAVRGILNIFNISGLDEHDEVRGASCSLARVDYNSLTSFHKGLCWRDLGPGVVLPDDPSSELVLSQTANVSVLDVQGPRAPIGTSRREATMSSVFLSYGQPDEPFATVLNKSLRKKGVETFFFPRNAIPGRKMHRMMREEVNAHGRVVLICSRSSLSRSGVQYEIEQTLAREAREGDADYLLPITLDDYVFKEWNPRHASTRQAVLDRVVADFRDAQNDRVSYDRALNRLLLALGSDSG
jgi:TIR domain